MMGKTDEEHLRNLEAVFYRFETAGVHLKHEKCVFMVDYLGHKISAEGLSPTESKVRAIVNTPAPTDVTQLKSFLGLLSYYLKFLLNLASRLAPLHELLQKVDMGSGSRSCFQRSQAVTDCI